MTVRDAFALSPKQWEEIEEEYEALLRKNAEQMVASLLSGATFPERKMLALGIMCGRASQCAGEYPDNYK